MPADIATPTRRSARFNATASTSATTTTTTTAPSQNLRKRARPPATEPSAVKSAPLKATKRRKITEEPIEEIKDVKGKGRARVVQPLPAPEPLPERPNHRKRKSMSALDDAVVLKKNLAEEAEVEVAAGRRTRKKQKSDEVIEEPPRKTRASASKTVETPSPATRKAKVQPVRPPTLRRITRSLVSSPATPALPVTTAATATATPPLQPPSPALSALSSLPPSPSTSPTQARAMPPPLSLSTPLLAESANLVIQRQTDAVAPTTQRITRYVEKKEEAPSRAGSPTPSTSSPLATSAVLEPEGSTTKSKKGKGRAKAEVKQQQGTKRKRGGPVGAAPIRRSSRLHPDAASTSNAPAASSPLVAHPVASAASVKPAAPLRTPPTSHPASPGIPPLSLSLAQLSPPQATQRHQGHHGGPRSSPVSPLAPPNETLPPVTPPLATTNLTSSPLAAESSANTVAVSTPSSPTRSPQMTLDRMDFGTVNLPSMGNIPALNLGPSSLGFGNGSSSNGGSNNGKKTPGSGSPRTSPLLRPMVPSALGLGMVTAGELSPTGEKLEEGTLSRTAPSPPVRTQPPTPAAPTPALSTATTPAVEEPQPAVDVPPSPTTAKPRSPSPAPSSSTTAEQASLSDQPQSSSPPLPSPLQDGSLLPQLPISGVEYPPALVSVEEQPRPSTPVPFSHQQHQVYPQQHYDLYQPSPAQDAQTSSPPMDAGFRPSSPAPQGMEHTQVQHHHTPPPIHTPTYNQTHSLADALGSPPPSPVQMHHGAVGVPQLPISDPSAQQPMSEQQDQLPGGGLQQIQLSEGVQQIQIPEATPQEIVQCQPQGLVQVELEPAPQPEPHQMQVAAPVPLPVSASSPPPQAYPPVWEEPPRLDTEKNLWRLACKVRVWDLRRRYSPEAIRALVTQEAHEYYEKHGFPIGYFASSRSAGPSSLRNSVVYGGQPVSPYAAPSSPASASGSDGKGEEGTTDGLPAISPTSGLHFMDEPVYDWEINSNSDDEDDLEAEFDDEDYEDDTEEEVKGSAEGEEEAVEGATATAEETTETAVDVKGKGKAKEEDKEEEVKEASRGAKRSPRKKRKVEVDAGSSTPKRRAASAPTPGSSSTEPAEGDAAGQGEKDMEVDSDEDHDLEEVNVGATSPVAEKQQQLDAEAQAEEEARRRDLDEALSDPSFNLELSSPTATSPTALAFGEATAARERSTSPLSPSPSPGGVFNAFYVPPAPRTVGVYLDAPGENVEQAAPVEQDMEGGYQETPAQSITPPPASPLQVHLQMPMSPILEIPPPRLSTVPVWALRSMDMMVGGSMGRGTPVDKDRKMEWVTVKPRYSTPMSPAISSAGGLFPVTGDVKKEHGDGGEERDRKPVLRLSMPGEDGNMSSGARGDSGRAIPNSSSGTGEKVGGGDAPFEPNDADWAAFLADLAAGGAQSSSASSIPGPSSGSQGYSQQEYQGHPPPYTPSSSTTLTLPGQHQQQHQQHPAFGMNVNMNLTNMFNMSNGVSGSPTTMMNFMPMHNMGNNLMNMGGMGNMSMPPLASPMPIGVNTPLSSPTHQVPPSMSPPHPSSAPPTPPPTSLVNVPMNMFGMGFGGNVQIGGASLQLGLTVSLTPGVGNNVNNSWFGSPPSSPPALNIGPDGSLIQDQQGQNHVQGSSSGSYSSPSTPTHEFDSNAMFGMGQMQGGMSTSMGVMSYGHPMNMGVAMGMGNGMGGGVAMGIRDGMSGMGGHSHPASPSGNGEVPDGSGSAQASPAQTSTASTLSYALG